MQIQDLKLLNFRNYDKLSISFSKNLNILYGKNGSGKTNLVEAIYVLALTRSFKQINDKNLIKKGTNLAKIEGVIKDKYTNTYKVIINNEGKKVKINDNKVGKISEYISKINIVLFNPTDLKMIKDTPSIRRKYLNISISQMNIYYLKLLNDYNKLVKIRNSYLNVITEKMIDKGIEIYIIRNDFIEQISKFISEVYKKITSNGELILSYKSDFSGKSRDELITFYKKNLQKDMNFGKTCIGIHHDDLTFNLDGLDLKDFGSEGQQKNAVIAWKFSEIYMFKNNKGVVPILILDDLLSELDVDKIKNILSLLEYDIQTFITTTEIDKISPLLEKKDYKKIFISNGSIKEGL